MKFKECIAKKFTSKIAFQIYFLRLGPKVTSKSYIKKLYPKVTFKSDTQVTSKSAYKRDFQKPL